jgi:cytochrome P450
VTAVLDPADPAFLADPYTTLAELRETARLVRGGAHRRWFVGRHADVRACLRDRRLGRTFLHVMGYDPPLQLFERWVLADGFALGDTAIPRGDRISQLFGAANRDPRVFERPADFDVGRGNAAGHIEFGGGIHVCIGAALARIELEAAVDALRERLPELLLAAEPRRNPAFVIWGLEGLRLARAVR